MQMTDGTGISRRLDYYVHSNIVHTSLQDTLNDSSSFLNACMVIECHIRLETGAPIDVAHIRLITCYLN
jgi:hypothetical protein